MAEAATSKTGQGSAASSSRVTLSITSMSELAPKTAAATYKAAKKFDRRQAPSEPTGPEADAVVAASALADGAPLAALEAAINAVVEVEEACYAFGKLNFVWCACCEEHVNDL